MNCTIDCAQFVLTCGGAPNWLSAAHQPGQPLPGIINLGNTGVGVLPEVQELVIVFAGLGSVAQLLVDLAEMVEAPGIEVAIYQAPGRQ